MSEWLCSSYAGIGIKIRRRNYIRLLNSCVAKYHELYKLSRVGLSSKLYSINALIALCTAKYNLDHDV